MTMIESRHVETVCVVLVALGIIALESVILPQVTDDAFKTAESKHARYKGQLGAEQQTRAGWEYEGTLCRSLQIWSEERLNTNTTVSLTGRVKENTLFVEDTSKPS